MSEIFLKILNMSFVASWLILAVILLRLALKKAPKWITCLLWGMVAVRLLCPMSFESSLSLIPNAEPITQEILMTEPPDIHEAPVFDPVVNPNLPDVAPITPDTSIDQVQIKTMLATFAWAIGMGVMLTYATVSYLRLRYKVRASLHLRDNIWLCDEIATPFLLGVFRPKIYIPSGINESNLPPIIAHENAHLKRRDHWWKPLGFLILAIHWFNPLVWLAYILLCRDIELACDEKVIKGWGKEESIAYSEALLSCSVSRRTILVCPLAFGEVGVKERVRRVLNYKKPAFWIVIVAVVTSLVLAVCFLTNPKGPREFPMTGRNLSDLDTDQILSGICEAEGLDDPSVLNTNADNFDMAVTSDFDLDNAGAIRFYYVENKKTYCAQLRLFYEENQYFVTERSEWLEQTKIYKLRDYLDALRYLPQEEIRKLSPDADHYSIYMRPEGTPEDYSRVVTYGKDGAGEIVGWQIHLEIVPSQNGHGTGADVIHAFYGSSAENNQIHSSRNDLDSAISAALADHYAPNKPDGLIHVESYKILSQQEVSGTPKVGQDDHMEKVTVYLLVLHGSFRPDSDPTQPIEEVGGDYIPTALTFRLSDGKYFLEEYWEPRDGGYYTDDIKSKFPEVAEQQVWDDQEIIRELQQEIQEQIHRIL